MDTVLELGLINKKALCSNTRCRCGLASTWKTCVILIIVTMAAMWLSVDNFRQNYIRQVTIITAHIRNIMPWCQGNVFRVSVLLFTRGGGCQKLKNAQNDMESPKMQ